MSRCRSCQADIIWAVTEKDKKMPVDAEPHPEGNITLTPEAAFDEKLNKPTTIQRARVFPHTEAAPEGSIVYRSHFATCPDAGDHRR